MIMHAFWVNLLLIAPVNVQKNKKISLRKLFYKGKKKKLNSVGLLNSHLPHNLFQSLTCTNAQYELENSCV